MRHLKYEADVDVTKVRADTDAVISTNHDAYRAKVNLSLISLSHLFGCPSLFFFPVSMSIKSRKNFPNHATKPTKFGYSCRLSSRMQYLLRTTNLSSFDKHRKTRHDVSAPSSNRWSELRKEKLLLLENSRINLRQVNSKNNNKKGVSIFS